MKSKDKFKMLKAGIDISKEEAVELKEKYNDTLLARCRQELLLLLDVLSMEKLVKGKDNVITRTLNLISSMEDTIEDLKKLVEARDLQIKSLNTPIYDRRPRRYVQLANGSTVELSDSDIIVDERLDPMVIVNDLDDIEEAGYGSL